MILDKYSTKKILEYSPLVDSLARAYVASLKPDLVHHQKLVFQMCFTHFKENAIQILIRRKKANKNKSK
jgi:hypothetical protein